MTDHDRRKVEPPVHRHDQIVNRFRHQRVQPGRRLIEEDNFRLHDQCACQSSPLSHAAAQLSRKLMPHPRQPDFFSFSSTRLATSGPFMRNFSRNGNATFSKTVSESNSAAP